MRKHCDVLVIGGGVIGGAIAYELALQGADVMLLEKAPSPAGATASGASAGGVRQQGRLAAELPLALMAIQRWPGLSDRLGYDVEYHQTGMTVLTDDPVQVDALEKRVLRERASGLDIRLVQGQYLHDLIPGINPDMLAGSYCPTDGKANPMRATRGFQVAAERAGATVGLGVAVTGFTAGDGRVSQVHTSQGTVECRQVIMAAGAWTRNLAQQLGTPLPIRGGAIQMMVTERRPHVLDQTLSWVGAGISFKQSPSGGFVIGGGWPGTGDLNQYRTQARHGSIVKSARAAVRLWPALRDVSLIRAWIGFEAYCPDDMPIIGKVPGYENVRVAAGFSGHGFCLAPVVGELLAREMTTGEREPLLAPFAAERFDPEWVQKHA